MKHLYFVRHGQSEANVNNMWAGQSESPLTAEGRAQAKTAGHKARSLEIGHIISSPFGRTHDTAKVIAREIGYPIHQIELSSLLIERHFGELEGKPWKPDLNLDGFVDVETTDAILERAKLAYEHLLTIDAETILVVSHGTFGRALRHIIYPEIPFRPGDVTTRLGNAEILKFI